jgi:hypothetical protein
MLNPLKLERSQLKKERTRLKPQKDALSKYALKDLNPGESLTVPITIDANGVSVGQYSDSLSYNLFNNDGLKITVPSTTISVLVSSGITPISNFSLTN